MEMKKGGLSMTQFKGFKTFKDAMNFIKNEHGGFLTWEERTPKRKLLTARGKAYMQAVEFGGLDKETYPYCVQWRY